MTNLETENKTQTEKEILRLKVKVNSLLDINADLNKKNKQLMLKIDSLKQEFNGDKKQQDFEDELMQYFKAISVFMLNAAAENLWLSFKNNTANTKEYYRAEKKEFEKLFDEINHSEPELDYQQFVRVMADLGILKTADNKQTFSVTVNGKSKRVYMIRKSAADLLGLKL